MYPSFPMPIGFPVCRLLSVQNDHPSIAMNLRSGTAGFASFFGNKPDSYADDANDKDNQHFYQLIKN